MSKSKYAASFHPIFVTVVLGSQTVCQLGWLLIHKLLATPSLYCCMLKQVEALVMLTHACVFVCRSPTASQEDEAGEGGNALSKHGKELQKLLKKTGLSESDDDESNLVRAAFDIAFL